MFLKDGSRYFCLDQFSMVRFYTLMLGMILLLKLSLFTVLMQGRKSKLVEKQQLVSKLIRLTQLRKQVRRLATIETKHRDDLHLLIQKVQLLQKEIEIEKQK